MSRLSRRRVLPLLAVPVCAPLRGQAADDDAPQPITRMVFGGDVMLSRNVAARARRAQDPAAPFRDIAPIFRDADIAFVNLESPFSDQGAVMQRGMVFKAEPEMMQGLELAGIDIVSTANNHARDRGSYGLEYTLTILEAHKIAAVGTGKTVEEAQAGAVLTRNGIRFGFLAYTYDANNGNYRDIEPRVNVLDTARLKADMAAMRARADAVIVSMHAGDEYQLKPNAQQVSFARAAANLGAAAVIGHHPHVRQPWEWYGGTPIFYSLGNLVFDQFQREETQVGYLAELEFRGNRVWSARTRTVRLKLTVPRLEEDGVASEATAPKVP